MSLHNSFRNAIQQKYRIFWEPGYIKEKEKQIQIACNYRIIELRRTGCYGNCPIYNIIFHIEGNVLYNGEKYVKNIGRYSGEISLSDYGKLCYLLDEYTDKYQWADFRTKWTDAEECIITVELKDGKKLEIYDYGNQGPIELWAIQQAIDGLKEKIEWKKIMNGN